MSDDDRAPTPPEAPWVPLADPRPTWPPPWAEAAAPPPPPRGILLGGLGLALLGLAALAFGEVEVALYLVAATIYLAAQAADVHPSLGRLYALLGWIPAALGALLLGSIAAFTADGVSLASLVPRLAVAGFAGLGAVVCLALLVPAAADACARLLFRVPAADHTLRLSATLVVATLWAGPSLWFVARDVLAEFLTDPRQLVSTESLAGGLAGYVLLAFAAVGLFVRRGWRDALARLGVTRLRAADVPLLAGGLAALWLFNAGSEWLERAALPALWERDSAFTAALAGVMGPGQIVLLGLSAGIGEEITLRGALQPKLGIVLTSLLFAGLHVQYSWYGMLSLLFFGLLLGLIRQRSSTTVAIAVHTLYDVIAVATTGP
jgi:hypothetical protein